MPPSPCWSSGTAASCTATAAGCWPPRTGPRTRCRRRCCGPGGPARTSPGEPPSAPGCTGSPPTRAWTRCAVTAGGPADRFRRTNRVSATEQTGNPSPASADPGPDALLETGEAVEGACRTIIELLPPKQRAVLILCEVLRCSSGEAAPAAGHDRGRGEQRPAAGSGHPPRRTTGLGGGTVAGTLGSARPNGRFSSATSPPSADTTSPRSWPSPGPTPPRSPWGQALSSTRRSPSATVMARS